jgi:hypothetical protein
MRASTFSFTLAALVAASFATPLAANWKRENDFFAPNKNGGSQLGSFGGDGEPMNVRALSLTPVISGLPN